MPSGGIVVDPWNVVADQAHAELARRGVALEIFGRGDLPSPAAAPAGTRA
jgi:hypothetical protein